jgi:uncharacterized protein (TIGR02466 family)
MEVTSQAEMRLLFPSPVMWLDWPGSEGLDQGLKDVVLAKRRASAGVVKTNRGGWQSAADLQDWSDPPIRQLLGRIEDLAKHYVVRLFGGSDAHFDTGWSIRAWANVNEKGHFNRSHDHLGRHSYLSGIYYVDVGDIGSNIEAKGRTVFEDRTHVAIDVNRSPDDLRRDFYMTPSNGRMVLFPAALMHHVEPYEGEGPRITIAFNLLHPGLAVPRIDEYLQSADWMWTNFRGLMILKRKIPEKLYGLGLIPRQLLGRSIAGGLSFRTLADHLSTAVDHAFALASKRFEPDARGKRRPIP